ncbi:hypothetical protein PHMEG_00023673 [Phytophthora megakarya]|uniref:Reverse transcriptase domain-containing protein n=1 Tax=Phytophthora megakarya TaxID=4795 RepID=A0A225VGI7_9STRA|nr:hypothetical protein PHMEG_00023673 [Phytophthora megakarya]
MLPVKRVHFGHSFLFGERSETFYDSAFERDKKCDTYDYVYMVHDNAAVKQRYRPGLVEVSVVNDESDSDDELVAEPLRHIACTPAELLIDSGAVASLIDARVLKLIGRTDTPLRPCSGSLNGATGHKIGDRGEIDLPLLLGYLELNRPFVVVNRLYVDAILAIIDLDESTLTLKSTREVFQLGSPRLEKSHPSMMGSTVRLWRGGQALVVTDRIVAVPEDTTVLVEGLPDSTVLVTRTLCSVQCGKLLVEVCNAFIEDVVIRKDTTVAMATLVPDPAFAYGSEVTNDESSVITASLDKGLREELEVDFEGSKLTSEQQRLLKDLLEQFRDMFDRDVLDSGTRPFKQKPYRVSKVEGDVMEAELQPYLSLGHIRPSISPWESPVLMIRKPDGGIRFCIDYRRLNTVTGKDCYPIPLIGDILDVLGNTKLFPTMDITSGYWNVLMTADIIEKTAFMCKYGLYEWLVMSFGLCNAVPAFERLMEKVLIALKWRTCLVYLDVCVVFSVLKQVLERFRKAGFTLKMKKYKWGRDRVAFLGHILTPSSILPNPEKVFLGLTSYFRRYIPGYTGISTPIERLKVKGAAFVWTSDWEAAFLQLKRRLIEPPILIYPDFSKRFKLYVDSSSWLLDPA